MRVRKLLILALVCGLIAPAAAQDAAGSLASLLALVPAGEAQIADSLISYVNYEAAFAVGGGLNPQTAAEFDQMPEDAWNTWMANAQRLYYSGPPAVMQYLMAGYADSLALHGFEWFAIDQALIFGVPPSQGVALAGAFAPEAVRAALAERDYIGTTIAGVDALCWAEGCDQGQRMDFAARDPAFLFGGALGRREPVALLPGLLLISPDDAVLTAMVAARDGDSVLGLPAYQALLEALESEASDLIQANILDASDVAGGWAAPESLGVDPAALGTLPTYALALLADCQAGDDQIARILLVYADEISAEQGAAELGVRLANFNVNGMYEAVGAQLEAARVIPTAAGWVAAAGVRYPTSANAPGRTVDPASPGRIYRMWMNSMFRREFMPIALEASAAP